MPGPWGDVAQEHVAWCFGRVEFGGGGNEEADEESCGPEGLVEEVI